MNKVVFLILIVVALGVGGFFFMQQQTSKTTTNEGAVQTEEQSLAKNEITIENFAYSKPSITIKAGESVTWTNKDSVGHTATADDGSFDTPLIEQGQSETVMFDKPGTYAYHCTPHPNMKATVVVK